jgi:hypothetical protein
LEHLDVERPLADVKYVSRAAPWKNHTWFCFVARCVGEPVGFLSGRLRPEGHFGIEGRPGFIEIVGILPRHRCNPGGVSSGELLVRAFHNHATAHGCTHLVLKIGATPDEDGATRAFFARQGFTPLHTAPGYEYRQITAGTPQ